MTASAEDHGLAPDTCLQCEQGRVQVKAEGTICALVSGHEYVEVTDEWARHHWRDWSDRELDAAGIRPEAWDLYRRWPAASLPYAACDHTQRGHVRTAKALPEFGLAEGQCFDCGAKA